MVGETLLDKMKKIAPEAMAALEAQEANDDGSVGSEYARRVLADLRAVTKRHQVQFPSVEEFLVEERGEE